MQTLKFGGKEFGQQEGGRNLQVTSDSRGEGDRGGEIFGVEGMVISVCVCVLVRPPRASVCKWN